MDDKFGREHERTVLEEFDKIKENFGTKNISEEQEDVPVSLEDIFGDDVLKSLDEEEDIDIEPETPVNGRMERLEAEKTKAEAKPVSEKLSVAFQGIAAGFHTATNACSDKVKQLKSSIGSKVEPTEEGGEDIKKDKRFDFGRKTQKTRTKNKRFKMNWKKFFKFALIVCGAGVLFVSAIVLITLAGAPKINPDNIYDLLTENSVIYDVNGEIVDNVYAGDALRTNIEYNQLPENLIDAFASIEDKTFFKHNGFNIVRIFGAVWESITTGEKISGTSTITQQLARNLYLTETKSKRSWAGMVRKIREAYYTVVLEGALSKEQILEAYLNTIYLGFNSNGIQAASQAYFSKNAEDLSLVECALLASLPKSPNEYAPIKRLATEDIADFDELDIIEQNDNWTIYYNPKAEKRLLLTLYFMHEQEKITDEEYETAKTISIRDSIDPGVGVITANSSSFFADYVVSKVIADLSNAYGMDESEASDLIYNGGLQIYSTLSLDIQKNVESEYNKTSNFPSIGYATKDKKGNILDSEGKVLLYNTKTFFSEEGDFSLEEKEYKWNEDGSLLIYKGNRLNIYKTSIKGETDYSIEFKNLHETIDGVFYSRGGGVWSIASQYKDRDSNGNVIISAQFFEDKPDIITKGANGTLILHKGYYTLKQPIMQPQSAMVIMDYRTGQIKAMAGGRSVEGRMLYNRATAPRQPGSAIKPLSVYSVALQSTVNGTGSWTTTSPIDDIPMKYGGGAWPKNWYAGYTGINTLRRAVEQSINACAVSLWMQLDPQMSVGFLKNMGVTTVVEYGEVNDINAAALALGGMTKGISPLEMAGAFGTFGNHGTYIEPICYTRVTNKNGDVLLSKSPITHEVMGEDVASLMTNILESTVNNGLGSGARIASQPVAGKTGTTSERYDIWFCGITPQYSAALWIGNDVNIPMDQGSGAASALWSKVMQRVCANLPRGQFEMKGDFVTATVDRISGKQATALSSADPRGTLISDIFIAGTVPSGSDDAHVIVSVCADTGYLATPYCTNIVNKLAVIRPGGMSWEKRLVEYRVNMSINSIPDAIYDAPEYYCPLHNENPNAYPISPFASQRVPDNSVLVDSEGNVIKDPVVEDPVVDPEDGGTTTPTDPVVTPGPIDGSPEQH